MTLEEAGALEARFANWLTKVVPEGSFVAAVSGGGDSVALLLLLKSMPRGVVVAHLDHALRPGSAGDAKWVEQLAFRMGFPYVSSRIDVAGVTQAKKGNLEATARELRYAFLARVAKEHGAKAVLTAHTEDDQAETVLLQLMQGTGRALGMRPVRGKVVRPLLQVSRAELREYLELRQQDWLEDITNADTSLDRSYLRHQVLPHFTARFPHAQAALSRFAQIAQQDDDGLEELSSQLLRSDPRWPCPAYRVAPLLKALPALRRRALRQLLELVDIRPELRWIETLELALDDHPSSLPGGWQARRRDGTLFLVPPVISGFPDWPGSRTPQPGDVLKFAYGHKRLVEFFAERGVPPELKEAWPVQAEGDLVSEVWGLWPETPDQQFMRMALEEAEEAAQHGEVPVGAVVVQEGRLLTRARNQVEAIRYSTAHAELLALQQAFQQVRQKVLPGATVYVTLEPCPMCFGALLEAQVSRVVYAAENLKAGAVTVHSLRTPFAWEGGLMERESTRLLKGFFAQKR